MHTRRSAFTLIELLLVVMLLGVIAALAAPRVTAMVPRVSLQGAARQIADDARTAQAFAADRGRIVTLEYDLAHASVRLSIAGGGPDAPRLEPLPEGVFIGRVGSSTSGAARMAVFPSGYVTPHEVDLVSAGGGRLTVEFSGLRTAVR